jgi:hypothetical protein
MSRLLGSRAGGARIAGLASALALLVVPPAVDAKDCSKTSSGHTPLIDMGTSTYNGAEGGLYPGASNVRPVSHDEALDRVSRMHLLDEDGNVDPAHGVIVLFSIGNSNTSKEFQYFVDHAPLEPDFNTRVVVVNGAQTGKNANDIANPNDSYWQHTADQLSSLGLSPLQVQAVWLEEAIADPTDSWPDSATSLYGYLRSIMKNLKTNFPNLRVAYQASRIYGGYGPTSPSHEPWCYEYGFSTKWLVEAQLAGDPELNFDPARGPVLAPWIAWGPYLWADGLNPRSDGLTWACSDFLLDGKHPSDAGCAKIYAYLIDFFRNDPTAKGWFADCDTADPDTWASPPEIQHLAVNRLVSGETQVSWDSLDAVVGKSTGYDVVRGSLASLRSEGGYAGASCDTLDLADSPYLDPSADPEPGQGVYYLVRGRNSCAAGTFGNSSLDAGFCELGTCGDSTVNLGEDCDGASLGGQTCASLGFQSGTLACAPDCTFDTSECVAGSCGDGFVDLSEECDGTNLDGETCLTKGFDGGTLACSPSCEFDTAACTDCGDGVREGSEQCDTLDLGGQTCSTMGYFSGTLRCGATCSFDVRACTNCGNGQIEPGESCDGLNLNGETCVTLGYSGGTLACASTCGFDTSGCTP